MSTPIEYYSEQDSRWISLTDVSDSFYLCVTCGKAVDATYHYGVGYFYCENCHNKKYKKEQRIREEVIYAD